MTFSREQTVGQTQRIGSIEDRARVRRFIATAREKAAKRVSRRVTTPPTAALGDRVPEWARRLGDAPGSGTPAYKICVAPR